MTFVTPDPSKSEEKTAKRKEKREREGKKEEEERRKVCGKRNFDSLKRQFLRHHLRRQQRQHTLRGRA